MRPTRVLRSAIVLKPSTLLRLHHLLKKRKYRLLFSHDCRRKPGPNGPSDELIEAVVDMKRRNPSWGCPRIAQQIALACGVEIDKDVVRRILAIHDWSEPDSGGPSWLTFLGHMKDSLWSIDLFRCESATLRTHWVLVRDGSIHAAHHCIAHDRPSREWLRQRAIEITASRQEQSTASARRLQQNANAVLHRFASRHGAYRGAGRKRTQRDIKAACETISQIWDSIPPPAKSKRSAAA